MYISNLGLAICLPMLDVRIVYMHIEYIQYDLTQFNLF
jgi:hypothetical protein